MEHRFGKFCIEEEEAYLDKKASPLQFFLFLMILRRALF